MARPRVAGLLLLLAGAAAASNPELWPRWRTTGSYRFWLGKTAVNGAVRLDVAPDQPRMRVFVGAGAGTSADRYGMYVDMCAVMPDQTLVCSDQPVVVDTEIEGVPQVIAWPVG